MVDGESDRSGVSRRTALRAVGSAAASTGLAATAGCGAVDSLLEGGDPSVGERPPLDSGLAWPQRYVDARNSGYAPGSGPTDGVEVIWSTPPGSVAGPMRIGTEALYVDGEPSIGRVEGASAAEGTVTPEPLAPLENRSVGAMVLTPDVLVASYGYGVGSVTTGVDMDTGEILWTDHRGTLPLRTMPVADGTLYVPGEEAILAVDPYTGGVERRYERGEGFSDPAIAIADGVLYWFDLDVLSAIDLSDGSQRWERTVEYPTPLYDADDQSPTGPLVVRVDHLFAVKHYWRGRQQWPWLYRTNTGDGSTGEGSEGFPTENDRHRRAVRVRPRHRRAFVVVRPRGSPCPRPEHGRRDCVRHGDRPGAGGRRDTDQRVHRSADRQSTRRQRRERVLVQSLRGRTGPRPTRRRRRCRLSPCGEPRRRARRERRVDAVHSGGRGRSGPRRGERSAIRDGGRRATARTRRSITV